MDRLSEESARADTLRSLPFTQAMSERNQQENGVERGSLILNRLQTSRLSVSDIKNLRKKLTRNDTRLSVEIIRNDRAEGTVSWEEPSVQSMVPRRTRSFTDVYNLLRERYGSAIFDQIEEQREETASAIHRRATSQPVQSPPQVKMDGCKRINYKLMSRPVLIPEKDTLENEYMDEADRSDQVFSRRVVHAVGKQLHKEKKKKKIQDGVVVFKGHPSWSIVLAFQVGLRHTSELLNSQPRQENVPSESMDVIIELRATTSAPLASIEKKENTLWCHHSPHLYQKIREQFLVPEKQFIESVASESKIRELPTPGKSGALFYITDDEEFFIKTITKVEQLKLQEMLPAYYEHTCKYPETLLTKFLANFSMDTARGGHIRLVAMSSIFRNGVFIDKKYDLKGSVLNRRATEEEKQKDFVTLKDLDLDTLFFEPENLDDLIETLDRDTEFLERLHIMDYSLLMGFSEVMPGERSFKSSSNIDPERPAPFLMGYQSGPNNTMKMYRISLGIIDILQSFTNKKRVEFISKTMTYCAPNEISVNPPARYRRRFMSFIRQNFRPLLTKPPSFYEMIRESTRHHGGSTKGLSFR